MWEVFYKIAGLAGAKGENAFVRFNIAGIVLAANIGAGVFYFKFPFIMIASTYATFTSTAIDPVKWMIFFFVLGQSSVWLMFLTGRFIIKPETTAFAKISVADAATDKAMTAYQKVVVATLAVYMVLMLLPSFLPNLAISAVLTALSNFGITALACVFLAFWNFKDGISLNEAAKSSFTWDIFFIVAAAIYIASVLTNEATGIMAAVNMYLMPVLSNTSDASANPNDFLFCVPAKIMSSDFEPLSDFILCSPRTHLIASEILLFPDPLGPITAVLPGLNSNVVLLANDLNPCNSKLFKYMHITPYFSICIYYHIFRNM